MNIFKKAINKAKSFIKATKKDLKVTKKNFVKQFKREFSGQKQAKNFLPGKLLTFHYDAIDKTKKFDKRPLVIILGPPKDNSRHTLGLNLHWLPESKRVMLASLVVEMLEKNNGKLTYEDVKPLLKKFEGSPILRRYAIRRISRNVIEMPPEVYLRAASFNFAEWSY